MLKLIIMFALLVTLTAPALAGSHACTGSGHCHVCKNCRYCRWCNNGGSPKCSVFARLTGGTIGRKLARGKHTGKQPKHR